MERLNSSKTEYIEKLRNVKFYSLTDLSDVIRSEIK